MKPGERMLLRAIRELAPTRLAAIGADNRAAARYAEETAGSELLELPLQADRRALRDIGRFELGVLCGVVEGLPPERARQLIGALRDRHCDALLLLAPRGRWSFNDFLALGFELRASCADDAHPYELYWYHVDRYNPEREWNNPDDWAHPENFKRYRW